MTVTLHSHVLFDASSDMHITLAALWKLSAQSGASDGEWRITIFVNNVSVGDSLLATEGNREAGSGSPVLGMYLNNSASAKTISIRARQLHSADQSLSF